MCPTCGAETRVTETRNTTQDHVRRRRICTLVTCGARITTIELVMNTHGRPTLDTLLVRRRDMEMILELVRQAVEAGQPVFEAPPVTEGDING